MCRDIQSVTERRRYRAVRPRFFGKCSGFTVCFIYTLALEIAKTSRGSDDHLKWRSRLLILNGMITEKIQHPNDFPPRKSHPSFSFKTLPQKCRKIHFSSRAFRSKNHPKGPELACTESNPRPLRYWYIGAALY